MNNECKKALEIRKTGDNYWEIFHRKCNLPIHLFHVDSYGKNKRKDVIHAMDTLESNFPWGDWVDIKHPPSWAGCAYVFTATKSNFLRSINVGYTLIKTQPNKGD